MRKQCVLAVAMLAGVILVGCSSQPKMSQTPATGTMQEPLWVTKGVSAFPEEKGKTFFGVGIAEGKQYPGVSLRRTTAIQRAREDLSNQMSTLSNSVFKDYQKACFSQEMKQGSLDVVTENVAKNISSETLAGTETRDIWTNPATGDMYALVSISGDSIAKRLRDEIVAAEKDRLTKDSDAAHKELDQIIDKYRQ